MRTQTLWLATLLLGAALSGPKANPQANESTSSTAGSKQQESSASGPAKTTETADTGKTPEQAGKESSQKDSEAPAEKPKLHLRLGTVSLGAGYSHDSGPYYYPYGPYGFPRGDWVYASYWYPMWGPYPFYPGSLTYGSGRGEVLLTADPKVAAVYIDGAYAGTADRLKSMWLDPGAYDLTVSAKDRESFRQRVYVLSGKSLKITAKLGSDATKGKP